MFYRQKGSKYNATKTIVDGIEFSSRKEAKRYKELSHLLAVGEISDLKMQVPYELIPAIKEPDTFGAKGGRKPGKTIERSCSYVADFTYLDKDGNFVCEDVKGYRGKTGAYSIFVIKRKLMLWRYNIKVREV